MLQLWLMGKARKPPILAATPVPDERYLPERNAINSENGDRITRFNLCSSEMLQLLLSPPKT